jgi:hypothetical protein
MPECERNGHPSLNGSDGPDVPGDLQRASNGPDMLSGNRCMIARGFPDSVTAPIQERSVS